MVATVDLYSRYAFRTDIAFDYNITADEIKNGDVNVFTYSIDKDLNKKEAYAHYAMAVDRLHEWQDVIGFKGSLKDTAINKMAHDLSRHSLYRTVEYKGRNYPKYIHIYKNLL